jgi:hypothetical protein
VRSRGTVEVNLDLLKLGRRLQRCTGDYVCLVRGAGDLQLNKAWWAHAHVDAMYYLDLDSGSRRWRRRYKGVAPVNCG